MELKDDLIRSAIIQTMSKEILEKISTGDRNAILAGSITETLRSYSFAAAIQAQVATAAREAADAIIAGEDFQNKLVAAVRKGVALYLKKVPQAVAKMMVQLMHGEAGNYQRAGLVLGAINLKDDAEEQDA
jgi:hypothetical protein